MVHAAVSQVNDGRGGLDLTVLQQVRGLLALLGQGVTVIRIAREGSGSDDQAMLVRDGNACRHAELIIGVATLAFADAFGFGRMLGIQRVLVLGALGADPFGQGHPVVELVLCRRSQPCHLALYLAQQDAQDRSLPAQHLLQPFELAGVGVSASPTAKRGGFAFMGEFDLDAGMPGKSNDLGASHIEQPTVGWMRDDLLLHRGV